MTSFFYCGGSAIKVTSCALVLGLHVYSQLPSEAVPNNRSLAFVVCATFDVTYLLHNTALLMYIEKVDATV